MINGFLALTQVHEISNSLSVHSIDESGVLDRLQTFTLVPDTIPTCIGASVGPVESCNKAAEVLLSADGRSLFVSNRGYGSPNTNTIVGFEVMPDGRLRRVGTVASGVRYPRGMEFCDLANGQVLLVAGQGSGNVKAFAVAPGGAAGELKPLGQLADGLFTPTTIACVSA